METLVPWKKRRDKFQDSDKFSGMGDQVDCFEDRESPGLVGNPMEVKFIMKDETNASAMNAMGMQWFGKSKQTKENQWRPRQKRRRY